MKRRGLILSELLLFLTIKSKEKTNCCSNFKIKLNGFNDIHYCVIV